eukprot:8298596-Lingulodinium_polyedra.AAC.1
MYMLGRKRWLTATEILAGHGWPVTATMVHASCGATCLFNPEQTPPETRTYRTVRRQVGNAMHIHVIGCFALFCIMKFPTLGKTRNMVVKKTKQEKQSRFSQAFNLLYFEKAKAKR